MVQNFGNAFLKKHPPATGPAVNHASSAPVAPAPKPAPAHRPGHGHKPAAHPPQMYTRIFRWHAAKGQTPPAVVEIVGGFTHWQKVPLAYDPAQDAWHVTLHNLHCGRMYHYMLLVDGQPARDKLCDGLAVPHGPHEEQYQLLTERGPRVLMLFAQSK